MQLSGLTLSWEDGYCIVSSYSVLLLLKYVDDLIIPTLFSFIKPGAAGHRLARAWFLKIDPVRIVCMRACVCVSAPEAINN